MEEKNQKLRASLKGQLKLAMKLEGLLRKRPRDEVRIEWVKLVNCNWNTIPDFYVFMYFDVGSGFVGDSQTCKALGQLASLSY